MIDNLLLIGKLPTFVLELFNNDAEIAEKAVVLDDAIAQGLVYKILIEDKLETEGYESGILYLTKGSKIKDDVYKNDDVDYTVLFGELMVNGKSLLSVYSHAGNSSVIEAPSKDTAIYFMRRNIKQKTLIKKEDEKTSIY